MERRPGGIFGPGSPAHQSSDPRFGQVHRPNGRVTLGGEPRTEDDPAVRLQALADQSWPASVDDRGARAVEPSAYASSDQLHRAAIRISNLDGETAVEKDRTISMQAVGHKSVPEGVGDRSTGAVKLAADARPDQSHRACAGRGIKPRPPEADRTAGPQLIRA